MYDRLGRQPFSDLDNNIKMHFSEMQEFVLRSRRREISWLYSNHYRNV